MAKRRPKWFLNDGDVKLVDVEELAEKMIVWSMEDDHLTIGEFIAREGFPPRIFYNWLDRSEKLKNAYDIARSMVGCRRERGALEGKYNPFIVMRTMACYNKEYRDHMEWEAKIKSQEQSAVPTQQVIVLEKFPESSVVPPLIKARVRDRQDSAEGLAGQKASSSDLGDCDER